MWFILVVTVPCLPISLPGAQTVAGPYKQTLGLLYASLRFKKNTTLFTPDIDMLLKIFVWNTHSDSSNFSSIQLHPSMTFIHKTPSVTDFVIFLLTSLAPLRRSFASKQYFGYKATVLPVFLWFSTHHRKRERDRWQHRTDIGLINCAPCEVFYGQFVNTQRSYMECFCKDCGNYEVLC